MRTKSILLILIVLMVAAPLTSSAFDGDRKGFMLNLGAGFGQGKLSWHSESVDGTGFATDFKIGGGPSSQVLVYYTNRVVWYSPEGAFNTWTNGMSAAGVSYFLKPQAPSFFFSGALGLGAIGDSDGRDGESGFGFTIGAGFEIIRSLTLELNYMGASLDNDFSISSLLFTVNWLAY